MSSVLIIYGLQLNKQVHKVNYIGTRCLHQIYPMELELNATTEKNRIIDFVHSVKCIKCMQSNKMLSSNSLGQFDWNVSEWSAIIMLGHR